MTSLIQNQFSTGDFIANFKNYKDYLVSDYKAITATGIHGLNLNHFLKHTKIFHKFWSIN